MSVPDAFREGVRRYMRAHAFGNAIDSDLWRLMQDTAGKPIVGIERDVTRQEGVPLMRVDDQARMTTLSEDRFAADPTTIAHAAAQTWHLPVTVRSLATGESQTRILSTPVRFVLASPVLVNAGQTTYARTLYPGEAERALIERIASLSAADQLGLLNDTLALGLAGYTGASNALAMVTALPVTADPIVWQGAISVLQGIDEHFTPGAGKSAYRRFALAVLQPMADRLGYAAWSGEEGNSEILRTSLERTQGVFGDGTVIDWARRTLADPGASAVDYRTALNVVASQADATTFDSIAEPSRV